MLSNRKLQLKIAGGTPIFAGVLWALIATTSSPTTSVQSPFEKILSQDGPKADGIQVSMANRSPQVPKWGSFKTAILNHEGTTTFGDLKAKPATKDEAPSDAKKKKPKKKNKLAKKKPEVKVRVVGSRKKSGLKNEIDASAFVTTTAAPGLAPAKSPRDQLPKTFEEWEDYVLNPLNRDHFMTFLRYHQAQLVPDEIFFKLTTKMLKAQSTELRRMGIVALGTYPSVKSFSYLAQSLETQTDPSLQRLIVSNFQTYESIQYVSLLYPLLQATEDLTRYHAVLTLSRSAQQNLKKPEPSGETVPRGRDKRDSPNVALFKNFPSLLLVLAEQDPSQQVRLVARQSVDLLEELLKDSLVAGL